MQIEYSDLLKHHGLRVTSKRTKVLSVIGSHGSAIPFSSIQKQLSDFDRVTLYRTMLALEDNGIIHKIQTGESEVFYAMCGTSCDSHDHQHQHIHFKCSECDELSCVDAPSSLKIELAGYQISNVEVQASGVCIKCAE